MSEEKVCDMCIVVYVRYVTVAVMNSPDVCGLTLMGLFSFLYLSGTRLQYISMLCTVCSAVGGSALLVVIDRQPPGCGETESRPVWKQCVTAPMCNLATSRGGGIVSCWRQCDRCQSFTVVCIWSLPFFMDDA